MPLAKIAARVMAGRKLAELGVTRERVPPYFSVKEAVFPFIKFPDADPILGPGDEVHRRGDGHRPQFGEAYAKAQAASRRPAADARRVPVISVRDRDKPGAVEIAQAPRRARLRDRRDPRHGSGDRGGGCRMPARATRCARAGRISST